MPRSAGRAGERPIAAVASRGARASRRAAELEALDPFESDALSCFWRDLRAWPRPFVQHTFGDWRRPRPSLDSTEFDAARVALIAMCRAAQPKRFAHTLVRRLHRTSNPPRRRGAKLDGTPSRRLTPLLRHAERCGLSAADVSATSIVGPHAAGVDLDRVDLRGATLDDELREYARACRAILDDE